MTSTTEQRSAEMISGWSWADQSDMRSPRDRKDIMIYSIPAGPIASTSMDWVLCVYTHRQSSIVSAPTVTFLFPKVNPLFISAYSATSLLKTRPHRWNSSCQAAASCTSLKMARRRRSTNWRSSTRGQTPWCLQCRVKNKPRSGSR